MVPVHQQLDLGIKCLCHILVTKGDQQTRQQNIGILPTLPQI